jgi:ABC-type lipoprotein export system ATPase subunit
MELLVALHERGKTVIIVTHDPAIAAHTKRIIQIKDGVIVDDKVD